MITQPNFKPTGLVAGADLSAESNQYRAVKVTGPFTVGLATALGESVEGILLNKPGLGQPAEIMTTGVGPGLAGAAIAAGDRVMTAADGRIITAATAGSRIIGRALEAATAANQVITVLYNIAPGVV